MNKKLINIFLYIYKKKLTEILCAQSDTSSTRSHERAHWFLFMMKRTEALRRRLKGDVYVYTLRFPFPLLPVIPITTTTLLLMQQQQQQQQPLVNECTCTRFVSVRHLFPAEQNKIRWRKKKPREDEDGREILQRIIFFSSFCCEYNSNSSFHHVCTYVYIH